MNLVSYIRDFYADNQKWVNSALWLFGLSILGGAITAVVYPELMEQITQGFADRFGESPALDANLAKEIFTQNVTASLIAWVGGLLLGFAPVIAILTNGFILGYVVGYIVVSSGSLLGSIIFLMIGLVPHGVFELPAFLLAAVLGMNLGLNWLAPQAKGQRWATLKESAIYTSSYFIAVMLLLSLAAFLEVFVSGKLLESF